MTATIDELFGPDESGTIEAISTIAASSEITTADKQQLFVEIASYLKKRMKGELAEVSVGPAGLRVIEAIDEIVDHPYLLHLIKNARLKKIQGHLEEVKRRAFGRKDRSRRVQE